MPYDNCYANLSFTGTASAATAARSCGEPSAGRGRPDQLHGQVGGRRTSRHPAPVRSQKPFEFKWLTLNHCWGSVTFLFGLDRLMDPDLQ